MYNKILFTGDAVLCTRQGKPTLMRKVPFKVVNCYPGGGGYWHIWAI